QVADVEVVAPYDDAAEVSRFVEGCDVVTFEFENVPAEVAHLAELAGVPARPSGRVLATCQDRAAEKTFLASVGVPTVRFAHAPQGAGDLSRAVRAVGHPAVVKTAAFGYDGKGQWRVERPEDLPTVAADVGSQPLVVEELVELALEVSIIVSRSVTGETSTYPVVENRHRDHILDVSAFPARVEERTATTATGYAARVAEALDLVGVLAVECFLTSDGRLLVNELAPRPHNSGHLTIEACPTSQFEQQLRAVCGLPLGATGPARPAAMANLLGEAWAGGEPDWASVLAEAGVALHLYGKGEPRPGRKLGHLTAVAGTVEDAVARVERARRLACRG
ncbi:MAG: 5-(carboxyamino)imidazole ribonucleotide synthase, partial [Acidimicrobiia bacterium]|nr:5-(carboxyamino)imidazole ribonucleotide synthase [Acidimicrobiia bacterium]